MDLERKVQSLEQEVEILKQQIQETLLGIQEQLLNRNHPSLRSDKSATQLMNTVTQTMSVPQELVQDEAPTQPTRPAAPPPPKPPRQHAEKKESSPTKSKVLTLQEFTGMNPAKAPQGIDWAELDRLEAWALRKIKTIGTAQTRRLIRLHMSKGRIGEEVAAALIQFVILYEKQGKAPKAQQAAPTAKPKPTKPEEDDKHNNLILRLIAGVSNAGISRKERRHG